MGSRWNLPVITQNWGIEIHATDSGLYPVLITIRSIRPFRPGVRPNLARKMIKPDNVALVGFAVLLIGVILSIGGMLFFNQVYSCLGSLGTACPADVDARFAWAFPLVIFGGYLILLGGFVTISGYVVSAVKSRT